MCFTFMLHEGVVRRLGDEESPGGGVVGRQSHTN